MDENARKAIERGTLRARRLLEEDFAKQLEGRFDVLRDGTIAAKAGPHLTEQEAHQRSRIVAAISHKQAAGMSPAQAVADYLRDAAFTTLNRFAALKLMEARGLVQECVSRGEQSAGFREYCGLAAGAALLPGEAGYRLYLECLFDELSTEVKVLFNRRDPASILWPRRPCLEAVLSILNSDPLSGVWNEDETLGWIYQYYNDPADRRQLRDVKQGGSAAPRNSREMAERNQFFTPRYVVEFLTDNALGRTWYEMTQGKTRLKDQCRYLVRLPNEQFLEPGEEIPARPARNDLTQVELLNQPVAIPHRPLKDPRTLLVLDPACGSMHFGMYVFELLEVIYAEAWELEETLGARALTRPAELKPLHEEYADQAALLRDVPRLILERNIHGVDIDPRAVQIAGLALWLRAQRAWQGQGVKPVDRPSIRRTQVVCAEPMPGEAELLREFVDREFPAAARDLFRKLLARIFDRMQLAGEAGSLLKIEDEIRGAIEEARADWLRQRQSTGSLFTGEELNRISRQSRLDVLWDEASDFEPGADFWEAAEPRLLAALQDFAQQAENGVGFRRRLFAEDAAQGFAFIDVCRTLYDVVLMNPPFGDASLPSKPYIEETYGDTKGDVYKAFVECFQSRLVPAGYLGIISSRTGFFLSQSQDWRTRVVLRRYRPIALADLGMGVLDAMVEVAAYVLRNLSATESRDLTLSLVPTLEEVPRDKQDRFSLPKWQAARGGLKRHQAVDELKHLETQGFVQLMAGDHIRYKPVWGAVRCAGVPPKVTYAPFLCVRVLGESQKSNALLAATQRRNEGAFFASIPSSFSEIPGTPFAYWSTPAVRKVFAEFSPFESDDRYIRVGLQTCDDFRFVRLWWEPEPREIYRRWWPFARGGGFSRYYADLPLVVVWGMRQPELEAFGEIKGNAARSRQSSTYYFRPGLTWPLRARAFSPQALAADCIFSVRGYAALAPITELAPLLGLAASSVFDYLYKIMLGRFGFPEFVVGVLKRLPTPDLRNEVGVALGQLAIQAWAEKRTLDSTNLTSHAFVVPELLSATGATLRERAGDWMTRVAKSEATVAALQAEIDNLAVDLYGFGTADRTAFVATLAIEGDINEPEIDEGGIEKTRSSDGSTLVASLLDYALGCAFGHWDIRHATGQKAAPQPRDAFSPLTSCSPGRFVNEKDRPMLREEIPIQYPVPVPWDGIIVDDPNHPLDLLRLVRNVLETIWGSRSESLVDAAEGEACEFLSVRYLREYFRRPPAFFADHLQRYSMSGRQAPIYWPLSTASGSYTVWLYYHRFQKDTLYRALEQVKEKTLHEERQWSRMIAEAGASPSAAERKCLAQQEEFVGELIAFREELERVAPLWNPDLNDGVILNYGPLWRMIGHKPWQKAVKAAWEELAKGTYDWAHLAMHLWPERVVPKCATDRSLAIAHDLEDEFWECGENGKWQARSTPLRPVAELVAERASPAVKDALGSILGVAAGGRTIRAAGQQP